MDAVAASERLRRQLAFVVEIDKLKQVLRQTVLMDASRQENSAEHSWHLAMMALVLAEYAREPVDLARVVKMLLVHDIVEIDAGDTFVYDDQAYLDKAQREQQAADRLFGLLPPDQAAEVRALWEEFEARATPEAAFAAALDRFHPLLHNYFSRGVAWQRHGVTADRVVERNRHIADGAPALWEVARQLIDQAVAQGFLPPGPGGGAQPPPSGG